LDGIAISVDTGISATGPVESEGVVSTVSVFSFNIPLSFLSPRFCSFLWSSVVPPSFSAFLPIRFAGAPTRVGLTRVGLIRVGLIRPGLFTSLPTPPPSPAPPLPAPPNFTAGAPKRFLLKISLTLPALLSGLIGRICTLAPFFGDSALRGDSFFGTSHVK
jgi:hypothetical protein